MAIVTRRHKLSLEVVLSLVVIFQAEALAAKEYGLGVEKYREKSYAEASKHFVAHLQSHPTDINACYYAGLSFHHQGNSINAVIMYRRVLKLSPDTKIGSAARLLLSKLESSPSKTFSTNEDATKGAGVQGTEKDVSPESVRSKPLIDRVIVYPPAFEHPKVRDKTVSIVKDSLMSLPPHIAKILTDGGVTITIAPNIMDKWPDARNGELAQEPGRTYDRDVHIYERAAIRGSTNLLRSYTKNELKHTLYHELGHALDDCLGVYSSSNSFIGLHYKDVQDMPNDIKLLLKYYTQPGKRGSAEACAELTCAMIGGTRENTPVVTRYFTRLKPAVAAKLSL